ncbi:MAG TPA: hypothetical protein VIL26_01545 [Clostridia bacterium]
MDDISELKKQVDQAHKELIESPNDEVSKRIKKYIDTKEKYFLALSRK